MRFATMPARYGVQLYATNARRHSAELNGQRLNAAHERCVAVHRLVVRVGEFNSFGSLEQLGVDRAQF